MRKLLSACLAAAIFLCSCGCESFRQQQPISSSSNQSGTVRLTLFGALTGSDLVDPLEDILNAFMAENPDIIITYEGVSNKDGYLDLLYKRLETGNADDLFMLNPYAFRTVADRGYIGTLIEDLQGEALLDHYTDIILSLLEVDGSVPGVPLTMGSFGMLVNTDLLRRNGITEIPQTYPEFSTACAQLKQRGMTPVAISQQNTGLSATTLALGRALAPYYLGSQNDQLASLYGSDAAWGDLLEPGYQFVQEFTQAGYWDVSLALEENSWERQAARFAEGEIGFLPTNSWQMQTFLDLHPKFNYVFSGLPLADDQPFTIVRASTPICVNANSPHKEEAMRFLEYLAQPKNIQAFTSRQNALSPLKGFQTANYLLQNQYQLIWKSRFLSDADPKIQINLIDPADQATKTLLEGGSVSDAAERFETTVHPPDELNTESIVP